MAAMTREEKLNQLLDYLNNNPEVPGLPTDCERALGLDPDEYEPLVGQLVQDGMAEWQNAEKNRLLITIQGKFLLRAGGYVLLVLSHDYQKKLRWKTRLENVRTNLKFFYENPAYTRWRRPIQLADSTLNKDWFNEKNLVRLTAVAVFVFLTLLIVLLIK